jgi:hypothetical protein
MKQIVCYYTSKLTFHVFVKREKMPLCSLEGRIVGVKTELLSFLTTALSGDLFMRDMDIKGNHN